MKVPINWLKKYIEIPKDLKIFTNKMSMIGHMLDKVEEVENDTVVDLELRGNRADCYAILGIAREASAAFDVPLQVPETNPITKHTLKHTLVTKAESPSAEVVVEHKDVHRFYSIVIKNIKVAPSPQWMQDHLKAYGIEVINNVVDVTNYVMIESGMPMHAFDLQNIAGGRLVIRKGNKGENFASFDVDKVEVDEQDICFADQEKILGLAGIVGSTNSGINSETTEILLECAGYDRATIRKSMFKHKAMTEAGLRHSHDLSSYLCDYALERAVNLIKELIPSCKVEESDDYYPNPVKAVEIEYNPAEVTRLGGVTIPTSEQQNILEKLGFAVRYEYSNTEERRKKRESTQSEDRETREEKEKLLLVTPPLFRTDILQEADIVEEVLRIYGYEKIPSTIIHESIPHPLINPELEVEEKSKDILFSLGLTEVITVPMTTYKNLKKTNDLNVQRSIELVNPATSNHTHMRTNMYTTLLEATQRLVDRGDKQVELYEVGKIYLKKKAVDKDGNALANSEENTHFLNQTVSHQPPHEPSFPYTEHRKLTVILSSKDKHIDYYSIKGILDEYLEQFGIKDVEFVKDGANPFFEFSARVIQTIKIEEQMSSNQANKKKAENTRKEIQNIPKANFGEVDATTKEITFGEIGMIAKEISQQNFGIELPVYAFTLDIEKLTETQKEVPSFTPYSIYPSIQMDMSVVVEKNINALELIKAIKQYQTIRQNKEGKQGTGEVPQNANEDEVPQNRKENLIQNVEITDVYEQQDNKRSILISIFYQSKERTLETEEVNTLHTTIGDMLIHNFNVEIKGR